MQVDLLKLFAVLGGCTGLFSAIWAISNKDKSIEISLKELSLRLSVLEKKVNEEKQDVHDTFATFKSALEHKDNRLREIITKLERSNRASRKGIFNEIKELQLEVKELRARK